MIEEAGGAADSVRLGVGVGVGDVALVREGGDLLLRVSGGGFGESVLRVRGHFFGEVGSRVESVVFSGGEVWDAEFIRSAVALVGGEGTGGRDIFDSDVGGDVTLRGGGFLGCRGVFWGGGGVWAAAWGRFLVGGWGLGGGGLRGGGFFCT